YSVGPAGGARGTDAGREREVVAGNRVTAVLEAEGGKRRRAGEIIVGGLLRRAGAENKRVSRQRRRPTAPVTRGRPVGVGAEASPNDSRGRVDDDGIAPGGSDTEAVGELQSERVSAGDGRLARKGDEAAAEGIRHAGGQLAAGHAEREGAGARAGGHGADEAGLVDRPLVERKCS